MISILIKINIRFISILEGIPSFKFINTNKYFTSILEQLEDREIKEIIKKKIF